MAVQIQLRRDTASNWTSADPTLAAGEFAIETDTDKYKIGDGSTAWTSLGYSSLPSNVLPLAGGAMTGAITTNSTFDGRDVAADGVTADAALPRAGGTMSGVLVMADQIVQKPVLKDIGETTVANGTSGSTDTIDLEDGNVHNVTLTAN